jgi:predicted transcriptional regulator
MSRRKKSPTPALHELESLVMEEVWRQGQSTVREVLTALNQGEKERAYTTVMTIMARLDTKGVLTRERQGKTDIYKPVMTREEYLDARAQAEVEALIDEFGDVALAHFAEQVDKLDAERLDALRKLAERG